MNENFIINLEGKIPAIKARYPRLSTNVIRSIAANFQYSGNLEANIAGFRRALKSHNNLARSGIIERVRFSTANLNNALPNPKYKRPTRVVPVKSKMTFNNIRNALETIHAFSRVSKGKKKKKKTKPLSVQRTTRFKK